MLSVPGLGALTRSDPRDPLHSTLQNPLSVAFFFQLVPYKHLPESSSAPAHCYFTSMPIFHARVPLSGSLPLWPCTATASPLRPSTLPLTSMLSLDHLFTPPARPGDLLVVPISPAACVVPGPNALAPRWRPSSPLLPSKGTRHD